MICHESTQGYSVLAGHYDRINNVMLGGRDNEVAVTQSLITKYNPNASSILDLGTGTGKILEAFRGHINDLVGIDISPEMLAIARDRVPEADFIEGDMSEFDLGREFDVELCLFNAINHLKGLETWGNFFKTAERHLAPNGVFIFDTLTLSTMSEMATAKYGVDEYSVDGASCTFDVAQTKNEPNGFTTTITIKPDNEEAQAEQSVLHQYAYSLQDVQSLADKYFDPVLAFDFDMTVLSRGLLKRAGEKSIRPTFVYKKKDQPLES